MKCYSDLIHTSIESPKVNDLLRTVITPKSTKQQLSPPFQDENDDDDDWNPCKAAGVCLMLLATCCEDDVVPHVLPFIKEHIKHPDWRYRDASVMAFGSILEGPELNQLKPLVIQVT